MSEVKELKDVVAFVVSLGNAAGKAFEDDKIAIDDIVLFIEPLKRLYSAYVGIDKITEEINNLTDDEFKELVEYAKQEFDIPQDSIEKTVELGLDVAAALFPLIKELRG